MRHSVHLMFGSDFEQSLCELKKYIIKYGEDLSPYFTALLWDKESDGTIVLSSIQAQAEQPDAPFTSGLQNMYNVTRHNVGKFPVEEQRAHIAHYFDTLYRETITINNPGDFSQLHLCLYVPLYDKRFWEQAQYLIDVVMSLSISYQVDIIGLAADTAFVFTPEEEKESLAVRRKEYMQTATRTLNHIVDYQKAHQGYISNFIVLQNCQRDGLSLKLDLDSFVRIIGEFTLLAIEHYAKIFIPVPTDDSPIKALGLSVLNFDKYYFVQYLLRRTYLHIMDKEKVTEGKVDITKVAQITQDKLKGRTHIVSDFYEQEVKPLLNQKIDQDRIIVSVTPKLNTLIDKISDDLQSFIADPELSLPEKRATLATLLGMDDPLLTGYAFNQSQLFIDDLDMEAAGMFIDANNKLINAEAPEKAVLSSTIPAYLPLKEIKEIREELRQASTYIREKEEQLEKLVHQKKDAIEADKRLTDDGFFVYEGHKYRLQADIIKEQPLAENYTPHKVNVESIDLRQGFTDIKSQGTQGSCSAFSLASVYEYILKTNNATNSNLSEAFLYYNTRKDNGKQDADEGVSIFDSVSSLMTHGICSESTFPYNESVYNVEPPASAYEEAENNLVKKALNVKIHIEDIRSALTDGYPVVVSMKLYNSFSADTTGFVSRPSEEEIKSDEHGNHAMVICGFSDEKKVFIIRNSWGTSFGENGYCYCPYSYVADSSLTNMACIITEVGSGYTVGGGREKRMQLYFDTTDANINHAIIKNLVEEEKFRVKKLSRLDDRYRQSYYALIGKLGNNSIRKRLIAATEERLDNEASAYLEQRQIAQSQKEGELEKFKTATRKTGLYVIITILTFWACLMLTYSFLTLKDMLSMGSTWYWLVSSLLLVGLLFLYFPYRKKKYRLLKEEWEAKITNLAVKADKKKRERDIIRLRMHISGMVLDRLFNLQDRLKNKYNVMLSFTGNLYNWYQNEKKDIKTMDSSTKDPFISLLSNEVLDRFFEDNKDTLSEKVTLSDFMKEYEISEEGIQKFNKQIKQSAIDSILSFIEDFKVYSHISKEKVYAYLDDTYADINKLLPILDDKSKVFLQLNIKTVMPSPHKIIFMRTDEQSEKNHWNKTYPSLFTTTPVSENSRSKYKIIVLRLLNLNVADVLIAQE